MRLTVSKLLGNIILVWTTVLFGLAPLFFIPLTSEFYEFNKVILISVSSIILLILWFTRSILNQKFSIRTSLLDISILIFVVINILAASFSVDRYVSIAGWYPRFNHSLILILSVAAIYFVTVNNITRRNIKLVILSIYASSLILSIMGVLGYFGVYLPFDFAKLRSWTPITSINNLGFFLSLSIPLGLYLSLKKYNLKWTLLSYVFPLTLLPILFCFSLINIKGAWIITLISLTLIVLSQRRQIFSRRSIILWIVAFVWLNLTLFAYIPGLNSNTYGRLINIDNKSGDYLNFPKEITLSPSLSYATAIGVIRNQNKAILGAGQGTFMYAYTQLKPQSVNTTPLWNLRFDQPNSEITMILSGVGLLGMISFLLIVFSILKLTIKIITDTSGDKNSSKFIFASILIFLLGSVVFVYSASTFLIGFALLALLSVATNSKTEIAIHKTKKASKKNSTTQYSQIIIPGILGLTAIIGAYFLLKFVSQSFAAETHFQKSALATAANNGTVALQEQIAAVRDNPYESTYRKQVILTDIALARSILQKTPSNPSNDSEEKPNISDQDQKDITALLNQAIEQGKIITGYQNSIQKGSAPLNVSNWETLALVYRSLMGIAKDAELHALRTQQQAIGLDPQNPLLYVNLGRTFLALGNFDSAASNFEAAIQRKPDYAVGYVGLSEALKNRPNSAQRRAAVLEQALNLIPTDNPSRGEIQKAWEDALDQAQAELNTTKDNSLPSTTTTNPLIEPNQSTPSVTQP